MTIANAIYLLCAVTSVTGAWLLFRHYRLVRTPLLLWSCIAFIGLTVSNVLLFIDLGVVSSISLALPRTLAGTLGMLALVYGLIWEAEA